MRGGGGGAPPFSRAFPASVCAKHWSRIQQKQTVKEKGREERTTTRSKWPCAWSSVSARPCASCAVRGPARPCAWSPCIRMRRELVSVSAKTNFSCVKAKEREEHTTTRSKRSCARSSASARPHASRTVQGPVCPCTCCTARPCEGQCLCQQGA